MCYDEPILDYRETELKEDVLSIQFKLVDKKSYKTLNSFTFLNAPLSKLNDNNMSTLLEILNKFKAQNQEGKAKLRRQATEFIPYNKSILTRVIAE